MLFKQGGSCHSRSGALGLGQSQVKGASRSRRSHAGAVSIGRLWEQGTLRTSQNISASSGSKMSNPVKQHMATAKNIRLGSHTQTHTRSIPRSIGYGSKGGCVIQALGSHNHHHHYYNHLCCHHCYCHCTCHLLLLLQQLYCCCYCYSLLSAVLPPPQI